MRESINKPYQNINKISIIIILYFSKHLLPRILSSINKNVKDIGEIILVNNSTESIDEFQSELISVINAPENLGYGGGINLGVEKAKYEFLLLLNPDLYIEKFDINLGEYKHEIIISGKNPKFPGHYLKFPTLFACLVAYTILDLIYIKAIDKLIYFRRIKDDSKMIAVDYVSGALIFTNKLTFKKIGGFDNSFFLFYEETDFCQKASLLNIPVISTSEIVFVPNEGKASSKNVNHIKTKAAIQSSKKYYSRYNGIIATKISFALVKVMYCIMILFMIPLSLISQKLKDKKDDFIYRLRYF